MYGLVSLLCQGERIEGKYNIKERFVQLNSTVERRTEKDRGDADC